MQRQERRNGLQSRRCTEVGGAHRRGCRRSPGPIDGEPVVEAEEFEQCPESQGVSPKACYTVLPLRKEPVAAVGGDLGF